MRTGGLGESKMGEVEFLETEGREALLDLLAEAN